MSGGLDPNRQLPDDPLAQAFLDLSWDDAVELWLAALDHSHQPALERRIVSITGCARCWGSGHDDLTFRRLTHTSVVEHEGRTVDLAWWAICPSTGEPILLADVERFDA